MRKRERRNVWAIIIFVDGAQRTHSSTINSSPFSWRCRYCTPKITSLKSPHRIVPMTTIIVDGTAANVHMAWVETIPRSMNNMEVVVEIHKKNNFTSQHLCTIVEYTIMWNDCQRTNANTRTRTQFHRRLNEWRWRKTNEIKYWNIENAQRVKMQFEWSHRLRLRRHSRPDVNAFARSTR